MMQIQWREPVTFGFRPVLLQVLYIYKPTSGAPAAGQQSNYVISTYTSIMHCEQTNYHLLSQCVAHTVNTCLYTCSDIVCLHAMYHFHPQTFH